MNKKVKKLLYYLVSLILILTTALSNIVQVNALSPTQTRLSGADRYKTAVEISKAGWQTANSVILATGENYPDALCVAPLAKLLNAPILLTGKSALNPDTENEIIRLGAKNIIIIGGPGIISSDIVEYLTGKEFNVLRHWGYDRYETAINVAKSYRNITSTKEIAVVTGEDFPDALSISSIAAQKCMPIILVPKDYVPECVSEYLKSTTITKTYVIGGNDVISDEVFSSLPNAERILGSDKYERNTAVLDRFASDLRFDTVYAATGANYPDALSGSILASLTFSPILLTEKDPEIPTQEFLYSKQSLIKEIRALGGEGVLSVQTMQKLAASLNEIEKPNITGNESSSTINKESTQDGGTLLRVSENPDKGFNYPYFLFLPRNAAKNSNSYMIIEPNNTGTSNDDLSFHEIQARNIAAMYNSHSIANVLNIPLLVPVFPRPRTYGNGLVYTHELDRDSLLIKEGPMKRIDLQLVNMIKDAQDILSQYGVKVNNKVFMNGYSASAKFVNRFTIMHPEIVRAVASGGINSIPTFPTDKVDNTTVRYPVGISDLKNLTGTSINMDEYKKISQYIYMGELDDNDDTRFLDAYDTEDQHLVHSLIGDKMLPDRWIKSQSIYNSLGIQAQFVTYKGIGHQLTGYIWDDLTEFFRQNSREEIVKIKHHD